MKLKICEICQQEQYLTKAKIEEGVCKNAVKRYAFILHNKDTYTKEDEKTDPTHKEGMLKPPHWHICLQFKDSQDTKYIAKWFGIDEQYVSKSKSGHYEDMLLYLVHKNTHEKYQYDVEEVTSNFDYKKFIDNNGVMVSRLQEITDGIVDGIIREFNYFDYITPYEYQKYKGEITKAYEYRRDAIYNGDRELEVIYITGRSGCGKTTLAKHIAKENKYSFYVSGSANDPLDGYKGQDCLILDDLRANTMKFSDFIKMIDNNTDSKVKSRYYNKSLTECKLIIITSVYDMKAFYNNIFQERDEPLLQFKRRCKTFIEVDICTCKAYSFDMVSNTYVESGEFKNPALKLRQKTVSEIRDEEGMQNFLKLDVVEKIKSLDLTKHIVKVPF